MSAGGTEGGVDTEERGVKLPTVDPATPAGAADVSPSGETGGPPVAVEISAVRLVTTLAVAGAVAGLVIVLVFQWAQPRIEAYRAKVLSEAVVEVLGGAARYETAFLLDGTFTTTPPAGADTASLDRIYVGYGDGGEPVGVALQAAEAGFQDIITLIFGYDPSTRQVVGMKVLDNKETPGLGDKIVKDSAFVGQFAGAATPLRGVKSGRATGADDEVDMITGATISSQAVVDIINHRLEALEAPLGAWWAAGGAR